MPSREPATPDTYVPGLDVIAAVVSAHPGLSLRRLSAFLWADLPWSPSGGGSDSALLRMRTWPSTSRRMSAAMWLADRCSDLALRRRLIYGPRDRREVDPVAAITLFAVAHVGAMRVGHA